MVEAELVLDVARAWPHGVEGQALRLDSRPELALAGDDRKIAPGPQFERYGYERIEVSGGPTG